MRSVGGRVILDGGRVEGEMRSLSGLTAGAERQGARAPLTTWQSVKLAIGWFAILAIIGLGVMIFAEANLEGVVVAVESSFTRAFWFGVLGQLAALPVLLLLAVALTITVLGILLVPFAVVSMILLRPVSLPWGSSPPLASRAARSCAVEVQRWPAAFICARCSLDSCSISRSGCWPPRSLGSRSPALSFE